MIRRSDILLLDVGGTYIKCGDGRCIPMPSGGSRDDIAAALRHAVAGLVPPAWCGPAPACGKQKASPLSGNAFRSPAPAPQSLAIGVAIPGPFDYKKGIFLMRHKFAAVYGVSFRELAGIPEDAVVRFRHDVIAALEGALAIESASCAWVRRRSSERPAEAGTEPKAMSVGREPRGIVGGSAPSTDTALVTIGTGLGFAHTQDGAVQVGPTGSPARSIYNLPWGDGILEDAVSARGIRNAYARLTGRTDLSTAQIAHLAEEGDDAAMEVFSDMGGILGEALAPVLEELGVGTLLLAGQVSRSLPLFERPLRNALDGIDICRAPEGAVFAGLCRLFDPPAGLDATDH